MLGSQEKLLLNDEIVETGIFKEAVEGRVAVRRLNIDGDRQADLTVHGGFDKAIYAYPTEHYSFWRGQFPEMELPWGMFGENLSIEGLLEDTCTYWRPFSSRFCQTDGDPAQVTVLQAWHQVWT